MGHLSDFRLNKKKIIKIFQHIKLLRQWNKFLNLTSILTTKDVIKYHYNDSIMGLLSIKFPSSIQIFDLGSGAGFPGIVASILNPKQNIVLVEKCEKKIDFLRAAVMLLKLTNVKISRLEVEKLRDVRFAISRAFLQPEEINKILHIFCKNGEGIFWVSPNFKISDISFLKSEILFYTLSANEKRKLCAFRRLGG